MIVLDNHLFVSLKLHCSCFARFWPSFLPHITTLLLAYQTIMEDPKQKPRFRVEEKLNSVIWTSNEGHNCIKEIKIPRKTSQQNLMVLGAGNCRYTQHYYIRPILLSQDINLSQLPNYPTHHIMALLYIKALIFGLQTLIGYLSPPPMHPDNLSLYSKHSYTCHYIYNSTNTN